MAVEVAFLVLEVLDDLALPPASRRPVGRDCTSSCRSSGAWTSRSSARPCAADRDRGRAPADFVTDAFRKAKRGGRVMLDPPGTGPARRSWRPTHPANEPTHRVLPGRRRGARVGVPRRLHDPDGAGAPDRPGPKRWRASRGARPAPERTPSTGVNGGPLAHRPVGRHHRRAVQGGAAGGLVPRVKNDGIILERTGVRGRLARHFVGMALLWSLRSRAGLTHTCGFVSRRLGGARRLRERNRYRRGLPRRYRSGRRDRT